MPAFFVSAAESGRSVLEVLRARLKVSGHQARRLIQQRRVRLAGIPCVDPGRHVKRGQRIEVQPQKHAKVSATEQPVVCYLDPQIVVVDKPAGLTTMRHAEEAAEFGARGRRYLPPTLQELLPGI